MVKNCSDTRASSTFSKGSLIIDLKLQDPDKVAATHLTYSTILLHYIQYIPHPLQSKGLLISVCMVLHTHMAGGNSGVYDFSLNNALVLFVWVTIQIKITEFIHGWCL